MHPLDTPRGRVGLEQRPSCSRGEPEEDVHHHHASAVPAGGHPEERRAVVQPAGPAAAPPQMRREPRISETAAARVAARMCRVVGAADALARASVLRWHAELSWNGWGHPPLCFSHPLSHVAAPSQEQIRREVQDYYGTVLQKSADLQTNACVTRPQPLSAAVRAALESVHEDVASRYYGCGLVIPERLEGSRILDLGSGSGRDCYVLSKLVGESGHVTGVDMTAAQVEVARKHIGYHTEKFGYQTPNVDFLQGYLESLGDAGLQDESYDIVISNCVVNLSPDKRAVLQEAFRVLKPGGEMYFSDVYVSQDLPADVGKHRVLWGECLGGALWWKDLYQIAQDVGFRPPRLVTASPITIDNRALESVVGDCRFVSATFRLFKVPPAGVGGRCQAIYNGGIPGHEQELVFDANFTFKEGEPVDVDEDTADILRGSRFVEMFQIRPGSGQTPAAGGCCPGKAQAKILDPFQLAERLPPKGPAPVPAKCCGPSGCR